jgi:hypothetical protein
LPGAGPDPEWPDGAADRIAAAQRERNAVQICGSTVDLSAIYTDLHGLPSSMIVDAALCSAIAAKGQRNSKSRRNSRRRRQPFVAR